MRRSLARAFSAAGLAIACAGWLADAVAQGTWGAGRGSSRTTSPGTASSGAWTSSAVRPPAPPRETYYYPQPTRIIAAPRVVYVAPPVVAYAPAVPVYVPAPSHVPPAYVPPPPPSPAAVSPPAASTWRPVAGPYLAVDGASFVAGGITYVLSGLSVHDVATPQGSAARARLQALLDAGSVTVWRIAVDGYGRSIARVVVNGADLSIKLRQEGFARA